MVGVDQGSLSHRLERWERIHEATRKNTKSRQYFVNLGVASWIMINGTAGLTMAKGAPTRS
jgi:hypothetical protein